MSYTDSDYFAIRVVNVYKTKDFFPVHRPFPLGNPFFMKEEKDRLGVCEQFDHTFKEALKREDPIIMRELARAIAHAFDRGYINLGCFCFPKKCHALSIREYLNSVLNPGMSLSELDIRMGRVIVHVKDEDLKPKSERGVTNVSRNQQTPYRKKSFRPVHRRFQKRNERWQD